MRLNNLTPLHCLPMQTRTPAGEARNVVIVKLTLEMISGDKDLFA